MPYFKDTEDNTTYFFEYEPSPENIRSTLVEITKEEAEQLEAENA